MKNTINLRSTLALLMSLNMAGLAVALFISLNIGSDTITVFVDGLSRVLGTSVGNASFLFNGVIVIIGLLIARKDMGWMSIAFSLGIGFAIDFYLAVLAGANLASLPFMSKLVFVVIAQLLFGITYATLIVFQSGMNPVDAIAYKISDLLRVSYRVSRTGIDVVLITSGALMGGIVGIGSIISVLTTGTLISLFLAYYQKYTKIGEIAQ